MGVRRLPVTTLVCLCLLTSVLALSDTPAVALTFHKYESQITEVPTEGPRGEPVSYPGPFGELNAMTVDSGDLFVAEAIGGPDRLDEFEASTGKFITQFPQPVPPPAFKDYTSVAVGDTTGKRQVYVGVAGGAGGSEVAVFGESSANVWSFLGSWTGPPSSAFGIEGSVNVAVDNSSAIGDWAAGDVYVADCDSSLKHLEHLVDVFKPEANGKETFVTQLEGTGPGKPFACPFKVTVDEANGDVLVVDYNEKTHESVVDVLEPEANVSGVYKLVLTLTGPSPTSLFGQIEGVAFDAGIGHGAGDIDVTENNVVTKVSHVYEFTATGELLDTITGRETPAGDFGTARSVTVDPDSGRVFIGDEHEDKGSEPGYGVLDVFGPLLELPDVLTEEVSNMAFEPEPPGAWRARLNGTVNPVDAGNVTLCGFAWGTSPSFGQFGGCTVKEIVNGNNPERVHTNLTGLEPDTKYFYRLNAGNANGTNTGERETEAECEGIKGQDACFTTPGPGLHGESVSKVSTSSSKLEAVINPHEELTSYHFEYDTSAYLAGEGPHGVSVPGPDQSIGSGVSDVEVSQPVQGLLAQTLYHYRVVVTSEVEVSPGKLEMLTFYGPDRTFRTQTGGGTLTLLDGRAWEQVSPVNKRGGRIFGLVKGDGQTVPTQASADGSGMSYGTFVLPLDKDEPQGYTSVVPVVSSRGTEGWSSIDLATPRDAVTTELLAIPEYQFFSEDLSRAFLVPYGGGAPLLSEEASELTPYIRSQPACEPQPTGEGCYQPLLTRKQSYADVPPGTVFGNEVEDTGIELDGATSDLKHLLLRSSVALTETSITVPEIYEWSAGKPADEALRLVSLLPSEGEGSEDGLPDKGSSVGAGADINLRWSGARNAISEDGSRVFWGDGTHLFMRDTVKEETIRLDIPQPGVTSTGEKSNPMFQVASSDGSKVFFTDTQRLTVQSEKSKATHYGDLYECEIAEEAGKDVCRLSDLTPEYQGQSAGVQNIVSGASEDGSYVYFVANGALAPGATPGDCGGFAQPPPSATCNLYVSHDGTLKFIASLSAEDEHDWGGQNNTFHVTGYLTARASPDGRYLTFMSDRSLTGYDNLDIKTGRPDEEVYLYDAQNGKLVCASCNPMGERPTGVEVGEITSHSRADLVALLGEEGGGAYGAHTEVAANVPGGDALGSHGESLYQSRYLSNEGRLFFNSSDALVPLDVNGTEDVYEYEPAGVGPVGTGCVTSSSSYVESSDGCVDLVSSGTSAEESGFLDASESGNDVFFLTSEKLVSQDTDSAVDVYDARVCSTAEPCVSAQVSASPCGTPEECRGVLPVQPQIFGSPASATFSGAGNVIQSMSVPALKAKSLTRAQKLALALRVCHKKKSKGKRTVCERRARKQYGTKSSGRKTSKKRGKG